MEEEILRSHHSNPTNFLNRRSTSNPQPPTIFIMKVIALIALCIVGTLGKPYYAAQPVPDIVFDTVPAAAPVTTGYNYQPSPVFASSPVAAYGEPVLASPPVSAYGGAVRSFAPAIGIVRQHMTSDAAGNYNMNVEGSDGTVQVETGLLKNIGSPQGLTAVKEGSYAWTSPEGQRFSVSYIADELGFRAQGAHLPTPPPMPEEIRQSLLIPRVANPDYGYSTPVLATPAMSSYGYGAPAFATPAISNYGNPAPAFVATPAVQAY